MTAKPIITPVETKTVVNKLTAVNITLTPREAYLLMILLGSTNQDYKKKAFEDNNYLIYCPGEHQVPSEVFGRLTDKDIKFLNSDFYYSVLDALKTVVR